MKIPSRCLLMGCCLLAGTLIAAAETEETINKRFPASPGGRLVVDVDFGSIAVTAGESDEVVVDIFRKVSKGSKREEERFLAERPVTFSRDKNAVTIYSRAKTRLGWFWRRWTKSEATYTISVPRRFSAQLKTSGGNISVVELHGEVTARTSGGALRFVHVTGNVHGQTSGGSIRIADCDGTLDVSTSGGGIEVSGSAGALDGHTSGGSVTVKNFRGPVQITSSGGELIVENVEGKVKGSTSGGSISAKFTRPVADEVSLSTSGGGVTLWVPPNAAFGLDASTYGGGVKSELPVAVVGQAKRDRLKGTVNGGGSPVVLRTSGGSIQIKRQPLR